jgi:hypothetical protein
VFIVAADLPTPMIIIQEKNGRCIGAVVTLHFVSGGEITFTGSVSSGVRSVSRCGGCGGEVALDTQIRTDPSVPGDLSDDSSSDEELRWSQTFTKASPCVRTFSVPS